MSQVLEAKKIESMADVEIGHILSASWGYDQTNIDYYKVVRKTAAMVEVVAIGQFFVEADSSMSEYVMPNPENELYETHWVIPGDEYSEKLVIKEKNWKVAADQGDYKPYIWNSDYSQEIEVQDAVKYERPLITKHKAQFSNGKLYVRINSFSSASSWDGTKDFQSHWA